ncbi:cell wall-associated NlpC family hydrolase [Kitasatospora sp. MAP12-15]|uniref:C40 family peptidase n=1 Tax=unclassified Kitasatospora TaxID=2633591 RepID=UPI00247341DE|nr:C40 family peptidase [Kitasatospora sp. MAP12-44]MDH6110054.1 cell wall-associated NlpC family hydrolase [Kitasatospora sp. MAP12-44]
MASHRRPKPTGRTRASILTAAAATAMALASQTGAHADPAPTLDQVKSQVDALNTQAEAATQQLDGAQEKQQQLTTQVGQLQDQVARQQDQVTTLQGGLAEVAADQYASGGISPTVQLMLSAKPDSFLTQAGSLNQMNSTQSETLKQLQQEQQKLDQDKAEAQSKLADLASTTQTLQAAKTDVQAKLAKAQALLNTLTAQQRQQMADAEAKASADAAAKSAASIAAITGQAASRSSSRTDLSAPNTAGANPHAAAAIEAAVSRLGDAYVYGATGPNTFDCSGLTQWAYAQAGVSLPRTSQEQESAGTNEGTNLANAQLGDLIIFYGGDHVGIYVGGGNVIHAPHTGSVVRYEAASSMPITAIVRPY